MKTLLHTAALAALLLGPGAPARAEATLEYRLDNGKPASMLYVSGNMVRVERAADGFAMIADTDTGTLTMIDHRRRRYTLMDRSTMDAMNARMKQVQAMMQAQLANLSEEQRAALEKQMPGVAGAGGMEPQPVAKRTGKRRSIGGRSCDEVQMVMSGQVMFSACVAPAATLGLSAQDSATLQAMTALMERMGRGGGPQLSAMIRDGVPLETTNPHSGRPETLAGIDHGAVDPKWFRVPAGYARQALPKMGMPAQ